MRRTRYPIHPPRTFQIVKSWDEMRALTEGLNEDEMHEWNAICLNGGGALHLEHQYWGGGYSGLDRWEQRILVRYLIRWRLHDWLGLRSWLYSQALHAAVYRRKPFTCGQAPKRGAVGGYSHWLCQEPRNHDGQHRHNSYRWGPSGDVEKKVEP